MVGLIDTASAVETVTIGKVKVEVPGISAHGISILLRRFPELRKMMSRKGADAELLMKMGPDIVVAAIAAGLGLPGDEAEEARARVLTFGPQLDLIEAILRVTFPDGLLPFVQKLERLGVLVNLNAVGRKAVPSGKKRASKSRKRSRR